MMFAYADLLLTAILVLVVVVSAISIDNNIKKLIQAVKELEDD